MDRRRAIGLIGALPAAALAAGQGRAGPASSAKRLRMAVVGLGRAAEDDRFDAVHLCLPVGLHAEYAELSLAAGKHVLCEKPLAATAAEARRLMRAASKAELVLMPAYRAKYSNVLPHALGRVADLGTIVSIDAHKGFRMTLPPGNWRFDPALSGGGSLYDIGPYSLQLTRWVAGGLPKRVTAMVIDDDTDERFKRVEPHATWIMEFGNGVHATGSASWRYQLQNRLRIGTSHAWIDLEPATPAIGERLRIAHADPPRVEEPTLPLLDQLPTMYDDFAVAAMEGSAPRVTAADGLADLVVIEAIKESARNRAAPVVLSAEA